MLILAKHAYGATVAAADGKLGKLIDILFDEQTWSISHLVLDGGTWLDRRRVTLPPDTIHHKDWADHRLSVVGLSREQIVNTPGIETHLPISTAAKLEEATTVNWDIYWTELSVTDHPGQISADPHLRNTQEVTGYHIQAIDGPIGHVADFAVDDEAWTIRYVLVDTRNWWPGKHVLIAPVHVETIDAGSRVVRLGLSRREIQDRPSYEESAAQGTPAMW
jgi:hypothetical protein